MVKRFIAALALLMTFVITGYGSQPDHKGPTLDSVPQYDLSVRLRPDAHRLEVTGTIRLRGSRASRAQLQLSLSELMQDFKVEVLEPSASAGAARLERRDASGKNTKWIVHMPRPVPASETILLRFSYAGGERPATLFYIGSEVSFASAWGTDWYPLFVGGDDKGTGTVRFSVPAGQTVMAEGKRTGTAEEAASGEFRFEIVRPTYFSFASGSFTVVRRDGAPTISAYLLRPRQHMESYLDGARKILEVLGREFGAYPLDEFALVEIPRDLARQSGFNAASVQGFVMANSRAFDSPTVDHLLQWYGHEFSHQWFPHVFALRTPPGLFMEEALAEYGGLKVVEALAGPAAAERSRRTGFEYDPIYSALAYFKLVGAGTDQPLSNLDSKPGHRDVAYNKGSLVFDMLAREIGPEKFRRIMHDINRRYGPRGLTWSQFLRAIEDGAGRDLGWFYEQWFERTGAPEWQLNWKQEGDRVRGTITQPAPYYRAALEIEIQGGEGQRLTHTVKVRGARTEFAVPVRFRAQAVTLDPHYLFVRWTPEYHAEANAARPTQTVSQ